MSTVRDETSNMIFAFSANVTLSATTNVTSSVSVILNVAPSSSHTAFGVVRGGSAKTWLVSTVTWSKVRTPDPRNEKSSALNGLRRTASNAQA